MRLIQILIYSILLSTFVIEHQGLSAKVDGVEINGVYKTSYPSGQLREEKEYKDGYVISHKTYFEEGSLQSEETNDFFKVYARDGAILQHAVFKNKKQDTTSRTYYKTGELESVTELHGGKGTDTCFYKDGKVKLEAKVKDGGYLSGQAYHIKRYDLSGKLIKEWDEADGPYELDERDSVGNENPNIPSFMR